MKEFNYEKSLIKMRKRYKRKPYKEVLEHVMWIKRDDKLYKTYEEYKDVYKNGEVNYAHVVMANPMLKDNSDFMDGPAIIMYSNHEWANQNPEKLIQVAKDIIGYRGAPEEVIPEELRPAVRKFMEDPDRPNFRFNYMLEGHNIDVHMAGMIVYRKFLPTGYLSADVFPVVTSKDKETVLVLPLTYWDKGMKVKFAENAEVDILEEDDYEEE